MMVRYPDYQVYSEEPAHTKPTSLGLANFEQAPIAKDANLPLSTSRSAWLSAQVSNLEGKDRQGKITRAPYGPNTFSKPPSLRVNRLEASNVPSLLKVMQLPLEWLRLVSDKGMVCPETVSFTREELWVSYNPWSRGCSPSSQTWTGGLLMCLVAWPKLSSPTYGAKTPACWKLLQRYLIESCRSLEDLEIQVIALLSHLQWQERDDYIARLHSHVPQTTSTELQGNTYLMRCWCLGLWNGSREMSPLGPTLSCWTL